MGRIIRVLIYAIVLTALYLFLSTYVNSCQDNDQLSRDNTLISNKAIESEPNPFPIDSMEQSDIDYDALDNEVAEIENVKKSNTPSKNNSPLASDSPTQSIQSNLINSGDGGKFLVISGSYLIADNAHHMVKKLHKLELSKAEVVVFDNSEYHTVIAGRYSDENIARNIVIQLKQKGIDSYVKKN